MSQRELLLLSITVFLTVLAWMLFDIYKLKTKFSASSSIPTFQTVDFKIDTKILQVLKQKNP